MKNILHINKVKTFKKNVGKKSVVLTIAMIFVISAFAPGVNSQTGKNVGEQPFEKSEDTDNQISEQVNYLNQFGDPAPLDIGDSWWNPDWHYRIMININHTFVDANSGLNNFPVLINITDSNLSNHAQFDGDDIAFADYNGNKLNHEIEFYDGNTGELVSWVNVTALSGDEDTELYLYYGNTDAFNQENPEGVWDSSYRLVQHLPHNWIPYEGNPIGVGGMQWHSVFKVNDTYYAYYHGSNQIERATSPDGKTFTKQGDILYATDFITGADALQMPSVIWDSITKKWKYWGFIYYNTIRYLLYAENPNADPSSGWTNHQTLTAPSGYNTSPQVIRLGNFYHLVYKDSSYNLRVATSLDGKNWTYVGIGLALNSAGKWDDE